MMKPLLSATLLSLLALGCRPVSIEANSSPIAEPLEIAPADTSTSALSAKSTETASPQIFEYAGTIGNLESNQAFSDFLLARDGQIVMLDVFLGEELTAYDAGEDWLSLWTDCPAGQSPGIGGCMGLAINYEKTDVPAIFLSDAEGGKKLRGAWQVRANPGMHQGMLSLTLFAVP